MSASTSNSKGGAKRPRKESNTVDRDENVLCVLQRHCTDDELGYLVVQHETLQKEAQIERHDNTNNPGKGKGDSNMKSRLLNIVLLGDRKFPAEVVTRLSFEKNVSANNKASRSSRAISLWTSVAKLVSRVTTVAKCFEKGADSQQHTVVSS